MPERKGQYTVTLSGRPTILGYSAVAGKREGEGPIGRYFDMVFEDTTLGEKTWEKAESALQREAFTRALNKAGVTPSQVNYLFAGDLLNQSIASTFGMREYGIPILCQFGACSTMAQTLALAAIFVDSGAADICVVTSLHDGMNLVCKEFVAARDDEQGVLILSRFAGAARELPEALIVNPYHVEETADALHRAATMGTAEQRERMASLRVTVREFNVFRWAGRMLADAGSWRLRERIEARVQRHKEP